MQRAHRDVWTSCHARYWSQDLDLDCRNQVVHFLEELGLDCSATPEEVIAEVEEAYSAAALIVPPEIVDNAHGTLSALKEEGLSIGLISNTGRTPGYVLRRVLEQNGLAAHIDAMVFSNEHGECKPRQSIFEKLRSQLQVEFHEMAFVGDNPHVDVFGARACGMKAVHFVPRQRGMAVAPVPDEFEEVTPDATIRDLSELVEIVRQWGVGSGE